MRTIEGFIQEARIDTESRVLSLTQHRIAIELLIELYAAVRFYSGENRDGGTGHWNGIDNGQFADDTLDVCEKIIEASGRKARAF